MDFGEHLISSFNSCLVNESSIYYVQIIYSVSTEALSWVPWNKLKMFYKVNKPLILKLSFLCAELFYVDMKMIRMVKWLYSARKYLFFLLLFQIIAPNVAYGYE